MAFLFLWKPVCFHHTEVSSLISAPLFTLFPLLSANWLIWWSLPSFQQMSLPFFHSNSHQLLPLNYLNLLPGTCLQEPGRERLPSSTSNPTPLVKKQLKVSIFEHTSPGLKPLQSLNKIHVSQFVSKAVLQEDRHAVTRCSLNWKHRAWFCELLQIFIDYVQVVVLKGTHQCIWEDFFKGLWYTLRTWHDWSPEYSHGIHAERILSF